MRNWEESNRDTTLEGKHWNGTPDNGPLGTQHGLFLRPVLDTLQDARLLCKLGEQFSRAETPDPIWPQSDSGE